MVPVENYFCGDVQEVKGLNAMRTAKEFFFVTRLFSGLYETIKRKKWDPTGIPTIVKLIEKIAKRNKVTWIIVCKTQMESEVIKHQYDFFLLNRMYIHIIPFKNISKSGKVRSIINDANAMIYCYKIFILSNKANALFYFDRSNIIIAASLKFFFKIPVVVRLLGLYPDQKQLAKNTKVKLLIPLVFLAYKSKFDLIICTQDGSGIEYYLRHLLNSKVKYEILLNGVKKQINSYKKAKLNVINFLFVGKLIEEKGIIEALDAFSKLRQHYNFFKVQIVGKGSLEKFIREKIKKQNLIDYIEIVGSVSNNKISNYYIKNDVYISLNKLGNLSNTVLEAMACGKCIMMLGEDKETHTDEYTQKFIPENCVIRIDRKNIVEDLVVQLKKVCDNPSIIHQYSKNMKQFAEANLWSWDDRIDYEIQLLQKIARVSKNR